MRGEGPDTGRGLACCRFPECQDQEECRDPSHRSRPSLIYVRSGGQTGADLGGWEAAILRGVQFGGCVPSGRRNEDGVIPAKYANAAISESERTKMPLREQYIQRTLANVARSDATVIFFRGRLDGGSKLTETFCYQCKKPRKLVNLPIRFGVEASCDAKAYARTVSDWLTEVGSVRSLNVAGNRESKAPGIQAQVREIISRVLEQRDA